MASGHTDKATINQRRPLTPGMKTFLEWVQCDNDTNMAETARMLGLDIIVPSKVARGGG